MKIKTLTELLFLGVKTLLTGSNKPVLGTIIVTDHCNLKCKHCAVNNINNIMYPWKDIVEEMEQYYREGIRILFLSGGETLLWEEGDKNIYDLIRKAREIGFLLINIVTNGTINLNIPEVDLIFLSLDGREDVHNSIRGDTYGTIMSNLEKVKVNNISIFMAINRLNYREVPYLTELAKNHNKIRGISFNFHTPYRTTEELCLTEEERVLVVSQIKQLITDGYPVFNLRSTLNRFLKGNWKRPCKQCVVSEGGIRYVCGRCSEIPGLCEKCGYLFAIEFSTIFSGNPRVIWNMIRTYTRFV